MPGGWFSGAAPWVLVVVEHSYGSNVFNKLRHMTPCERNAVLGLAPWHTNIDRGIMTATAEKLVQKGAVPVPAIRWALREMVSAGMPSGDPKPLAQPLSGDPQP